MNNIEEQLLYKTTNECKRLSKRADEYRFGLVTGSDTGRHLHVSGMIILTDWLCFGNGGRIGLYAYLLCLTVESKKGNRPADEEGSSTTRNAETDFWC